MGHSSQTSPPPVVLPYISNPPQRQSNRAASVAFVLGFASITFFMLLIASAYIPYLELAQGLFFLLWIGCALGAVVAGALGLLDARRAKSLRRDYLWVGLAIGCITFLLILFGLLIVVYQSDRFLAHN
jgi:hypothetical protein